VSRPRSLSCALVVGLSILLAAPRLVSQSVVGTFDMTLAATSMIGGTGEKAATLALLSDENEVSFLSRSGDQVAKWPCVVETNCSSALRALVRVAGEDKAESCLLLSSSGHLALLRARDGSVLWQIEKKAHFAASLGLADATVGAETLLVGSPGALGYFSSSLWTCSLKDGSTNQIDVPAGAVRLGMGISMCSWSAASESSASASKPLIIVGAPEREQYRQFKPEKNGSVILVQDGKYLRSLDGETPSFGSAVAVLRESGKAEGRGDVLVVASPNGTSMKDPGRIELFSLPSLEKRGVVSAGEAADGFGQCILPVDDLTGDGREDLMVVSRPHDDRDISAKSSHVAVYDPVSGAKLRDIPVPVTVRFDVIRLQRFGDVLGKDGKPQYGLTVERTDDDGIWYSLVVVSL
jgi:hypothetical protein